MKRHLYLATGLLAIALGAIGVFLPILPTVPFLILAAFSFARSNPAWEARLLNHPRYGATLRQWREKGIVSRNAKWAATGAFAVSIAIGTLTLSAPWVLVPPLVALATGSWLWLRPEE